MYLLIYFWLCWVFVAVHGLSLVVVSRGYSSLWCEGFSLQWLLSLQSTGILAMQAQELWHLGLVLHDMWNLPRPGIKLVSPTLAGRFLTSWPPWMPPSFNAGSIWGFPDSSVDRESTCNVGDPGSIPGSGRSAGDGRGYPLQCSWTFLWLSW